MWLTAIPAPLHPLSHSSTHPSWKRVPCSATALRPGSYRPKKGAGLGMGIQVAPSRQGAAKGQAQYVHWAGKRAGQLWGLLSRRDPFPKLGTAQREQTGCQTKQQQWQQSTNLPGTEAELGLSVKAMIRLPCVGRDLSEAVVLLASHGPVSDMSRVQFQICPGSPLIGGWLRAPLLPLPTIRTCPHPQLGWGRVRGMRGLWTHKGKSVQGLTGWRCYLEICRAVTTGFILKYCLNLSFAYLPRGERDRCETLVPWLRRVPPAWRDHWDPLAAVV